MCGIIGTNISTSLVERGLASMQRGNDGTKTINIDGISLGFKRHQVIGGNSGLQPLSNGQKALVFNGELFDFKHLAQSFGKQLTPDLSDSEVLFHILCKKGINTLDALNIMAAGAFLCLKQNNLVLFRDWVGEMPLHYATPEPGRWIFASTCHAITQTTGLSIDTIQEVPPGGRVYLPLFGNNIRIEYPKKPSDLALEIKIDEAAPLVRQTLEHAAKSRYWPHAPSAVMVSGGIDSTITLILTLQRWRHRHRLPIYTFHCRDQPVTADTDLYHALRVAEHFDGLVDHHIVLVSADNIIAALDETIYALEDKRGKDFNIITALYNRFIAQSMAKDGIKVVYEGEGADEALASYDPWGSYTVNAQISGEVGFRQKMVANLHKGVLMRTSKVMMHFGPVECRSYFLDQKVNDLLSHLPIDVVRFNDHRKGILAQAFSDILPEFLLHRPKARPQDASGILQVIQNYFGNLDILTGQEV